MKKRLIALLLAFIISHTIFASGQSENVHLRMATTTSTDNSGLLNLLLPVFEKDSRYKVDVIAVGTGKAITLGENGDVDVRIFFQGVTILEPIQKRKLSGR
jgi:tungstate transport system substrate-binding protein